MPQFELVSEYEPAGDQPEAIAALVAGLERGEKHQTLLGVTGSGKTYTVANVIQEVQRPTLVISHNKTLAAQLYAELKAFFPNNAVGYFISYYDYYLPEAYLPQTDTYIAKDSHINEEIEKLRLAATSMLLQRRDVIIVASVSCIYGLGSPEDFRAMSLQLETGGEYDRKEVLNRLVELRYERNDVAPSRGQFRVTGDTLDIFPAYGDTMMRVSFWDEEVESVVEKDPLTLKTIANLDELHLFPATHFVLPPERLQNSLEVIREEMKAQVRTFEEQGKLIEAQRIFERTQYDLEMMKEMGFCTGIENYSRHLGGREPGSAPNTLIDFFPDDYLVVVDESHVTLPQVRGMYNADQSRKRVLVDHGFRLPSAMDNRPLQFDEFEERVTNAIYVTATPASYEIERSVPVQQVIRPTGLLDPVIEVRPLGRQIDDLMEEVRLRTAACERTLVTTLTKRTAEDLSDYLNELGMRVKYVHSDIDALERVDILRDLRAGNFDCLVGVNLLREGLDLPEVALVAVLDADKQGFLRSETALIQTAGRAARNVNGRVILYADQMTDAMKALIKLTDDRRERQSLHNEKHGIVPKTVVRSVHESIRPESDRKEETADTSGVLREEGDGYAVRDTVQVIEELRQEMLLAASALEFERAAMLRDQINRLEKGEQI